MTTTLTQTFNRDDIRRVYASFAADYRMVAEWTNLHSTPFVDTTIDQIGALAEAEYLREVHLQLKSSRGAIRQAAVYRVSTNASGWSSDSYEGDGLHIIVYFSDKWWELSNEQREAFANVHMRGWGTTNFNGNYGIMSSSSDRRYASRDYGMERTRYSA